MMAYYLKDLRKMTLEALEELLDKEKVNCAKFTFSALRLAGMSKIEQVIKEKQN